MQKSLFLSVQTCVKGRERSLGALELVSLEFRDLEGRAEVKEWREGRRTCERSKAMNDSV